jgi:hypothetical protein
MGARAYPPEKKIAVRYLVFTFFKMEPQLPPLDLENCLAQVLHKAGA